MFDAVKDSGSREQFETGSQRDTREGKGRYDLISTIAMKRLAQHCENGAKKYGDRNWEKGQYLMRYLDSATRHIFTGIDMMRQGKLLDEDHFIAAVWNLMSFVDTQVRIERGELPKTLDDTPRPEPKPECPEPESPTARNDH